jgi:DNA-binding transcriptional LysR family regulator
VNKSFDYNLTKFLVAVIESKSMVAAAEKLDLAPSGVSNAIAKLREHFNDPLFIKINGGVQPTPLANILYQRYAPIVAVMEDTAKINTVTSPQEKRRYQIRTNGLIEYWLSFYVLKTKYLSAGTGLNFVSSAIDNDLRLNMLRRREIDLDIGLPLERDASIYSELLFSLDVTIICRNNHPRIGYAISSVEFLYEKHATWSSVNHYSELSESMEELFIQRDSNVLISSESFINMLLNVAHSDLIMLVPRFFLPLIKANFPIREVKADFIKERKSHIFAYFHKSEANNRLIRQLIDIFKEINKNN